MALHNLGWFYLMLGAILLDVIFALITSIFALIYCGINMKISYTAFVFVVLSALVTLGAGGYMSFGFTVVGAVTALGVGGYLSFSVL